jgi:hypothetical protein
MFGQSQRDKNLAETAAISLFLLLERPRNIGGLHVSTLDQ